MGGSKAHACTILLRGGAEQFIAETERSLHDAIMIVRRAKKNDTIVAGGGAIEMELSRHIREIAMTIKDKEQFFWKAYAKAFEVIVEQILNSTEKLVLELKNLFMIKDSSCVKLWVQFCPKKSNFELKRFVQNWKKIILNIFEFKIRFLFDKMDS